MVSDHEGEPNKEAITSVSEQPDVIVKEEDEDDTKTERNLLNLDVLMLEQMKGFLATSADARNKLLKFLDEQQQEKESAVAPSKKRKGRVVDTTIAPSPKRAALQTPEQASKVLKKSEIESTPLKRQVQVFAPVIDEPQETLIDEHLDSSVV